MRRIWKAFSRTVVLAVLLWMAAQGNSAAREAALQEGDSEGVPPEVARRIEELSSRNPAVQKKAIIALGKMGEQAAPAVPSLIELWGNRDVPAFRPYRLAVYGAVAEALEGIGEPAVEPLIQALTHREALVRAQAAETLGRLKDPRAIEPLINALKDKEPFVRDNAQEALRKITRRDFGQDSTRWRKWWVWNKGSSVKSR